jgi:hypothetical protein
MEERLCSCHQAEIETPIIQTTGRFHHEIIVSCAEVAQDFIHTAKDFDTAILCSLPIRSLARSLFPCFVLRSELYPFRLFHWLIGGVLFSNPVNEGNSPTSYPQYLDSDLPILI